MRKLFVSIDVQNDFMYPNGALYVENNILPNVYKLVDYAVKDPNTSLMGSLDTHSSISKELQQNGGEFPIHCINGTFGWLPVHNAFPKNSVIFSEESSDRLWSTVSLSSTITPSFFEKDSLNLFSNPLVDQYLSFYSKDETKVYIFGVATDFCVKLAVKGFLERKYHVSIIENAVVGVNKNASKSILDNFREQGVKIISTEEAMK